VILTVTDEEEMARGTGVELGGITVDESGRGWRGGRGHLRCGVGSSFSRVPVGVPFFGEAREDAREFVDNLREDVWWLGGGRRGVGVEEGVGALTERFEYGEGDVFRVTDVDGKRLSVGLGIPVVVVITMA
jgi:hypothetical protein